VLLLEIKNMRVFFFTFFFLVFSARAQELSSFNQQRLQTDQRLMVTLGSWSAVNFIGSGIGWALSEPGEARYFHQMNVYWNVVNAALAIPGYFKSRNSDPSLTTAETIRMQYKTEKTFLFNAGLDLTYMTAGFMLRNDAKYNVEKRDQLNGFGNSLLLQGGFLFIFDVAAHVIHAKHRTKKLEPLLDKLTLSSTGLGLRFELSPTPQKNLIPITTQE